MFEGVDRRGMGMAGPKLEARTELADEASGKWILKRQGSRSCIGELPLKDQGDYSYYNYQYPV